MAGELPDGVGLILLRPTQTVSIRSWVERAHRSHAFSSAAHQDFELAWPQEGVLEYRVGKKQYAVTPGSAILLAAGHQHSTSMSAGTRACSVHLAADLIADVAEVLGPSLQRQQLQTGLLPAPERALALGGLLLEECREAGPGSTLAADGLSEALAVQLLRGASQQAGGRTCRDPRVARVLQAIEESDGTDLDVEQLARLAGMSRYHFSRVFREVTGRSPYQHLLDVRLAHAAELLRGGHASVTEAALTAGFVDFGRFASYFQKRFGCLPSQMAASRSARRMARIA